MSTIVEFLKARLDEDEQTAQAATGDNWYWQESEGDDSADDQGPWLTSDAVVEYQDHRSGETRTFPKQVQVTSTWITGAWGGLSIDDTDKAHIARHDPARVLREVAAQRAIVHALELVIVHALEQVPDAPSLSSYVRGVDRGYTEAMRDCLGHLASAYSDHPDYRAEWTL